MLAVLKRDCEAAEVDDLVALFEARGMHPEIHVGAERTVVELLDGGGASALESEVLAREPAVARSVDHFEERAKPFLATESPAEGGTRRVEIRPGVVVGGRAVAVIAGPCSVENRDELFAVADAVREAGAVGLRGGAFKPRTNPYSFRGLGERALQWLAEARERTGLAVVTEVMRAEQIALVGQYADVLQVGSRSMDNFDLLLEVGRQARPVLLKRGAAATLDEFLWAAEYVLQGGNRDVILCERGIRTHEEYVRYTLALSAVPEIHARSSLPIIVDPSHGTGHRHLVTAMSLAGFACGADGLLVEVHPEPDRAWSDGPQSLDVALFAGLMERARSVIAAVDRTV